MRIINFNHFYRIGTKYLKTPVKFLTWSLKKALSRKKERPEVMKDEEGME